MNSYINKEHTKRLETVRTGFYPCRVCLTAEQYEEMKAKHPLAYPAQGVRNQGIDTSEPTNVRV